MYRIPQMIFMLLKMFFLTFECFIIHLRFIFVYYDWYVLYVLEIGERATV